MSVTQNEKIRQITETTMVIGVDIASESHWARAFDWRGVEIAKAIRFENDREGFSCLTVWIHEVASREKKDQVIIGAEPTGHYWFTLAEYLKNRAYGTTNECAEARGSGDIRLVLVNPHHVKKSKELDDNHPSKSDLKDPKIIARLVLEGRYCEPYIPAGVYADLRILMNLRERVLREMVMAKNQIQRWLKIYFPEHKAVFGNFSGKGSMAILREAPLPSELAALGAEGINAIWRSMKLRSLGQKRAQQLYEAAKNSIGCTEGLDAASMEIRILLDDYSNKLRQHDEIMERVEILCEQLPEIAKMMEIKGIGLLTAAGFVAEVGDIRRFDSPRQIQKLAGLAITQNSSGKFKGQTGISRRGRSRLRKILFLAAIALAKSNSEFRSLHKYYTTRDQNPLKKKQSIIAMSCKLIRVFYAIITKERAYDPVKMLADIHRNQPLEAA